MTDARPAVSAVEFAARALGLARPRRIAITGASGFVGRSLLDLLNEAALAGPRIEVTAVSRHPVPEASSRWSGLHLQWAPCDLTSQVPDLPVPELVIHAASAAVSASGSSSEERAGTELLIADGLCEWVAQSRTAPHVVLVSSGAVYGEQSKSLLRIAPTAAVDVKSADPYTAAKLAVEQRLIRERDAGSIGLTVARLFAFLGPNFDRHSHYAFAQFIDEALGSGVITIRGGGRKIRTYLFEQDMAAWLVTALLAGPLPQAINVGSGRAISLHSLARVVGRLTGADIQTRTVSESQGRQRYVPDVTSTKALLGVQEWTPLARGLQLTIDRWQQTAHQSP